MVTYLTNDTFKFLIGQRITSLIYFPQMVQLTFLVKS